jgi:hypothetical protein
MTVGYKCLTVAYQVRVPVAIAKYMYFIRLRIPNLYLVGGSYSFLTWTRTATAVYIISSSTVDCQLYEATVTPAS